jgi:hypothetical protein
MQGLVQPSHPRCSTPFLIGALIRCLEFDSPYHTLQSSTTARTSSQSRFVGVSRGGITSGQPRTPSLPWKVARNLLRDFPEYLDLHYAASVCSQALLNARKAYSASSRASLSSRVPSWQSSRPRARTAISASETLWGITLLFFSRMAALYRVFQSLSFGHGGNAVCMVQLQEGEYSPWNFGSIPPSVTAVKFMHHTSM